MTYENPRIPEGINVARESVPAEFLRLLAGLLLVVVVAALVLHLAGGWLARQIPFALERAWVGERLLVPPGIGTDVADARAQEHVQALARDLAAGMALPQGMTVRVHLVREEVPNAFATLGGHVLVTDGLYRRLPSENALAMVRGARARAPARPRPDRGGRRRCGAHAADAGAGRRCPGAGAAARAPGAARVFAPGRGARRRGRDRGAAAATTATPAARRGCSRRWRTTMRRTASCPRCWPRTRPTPRASRGCRRPRAAGTRQCSRWLPCPRCRCGSAFMLTVWVGIHADLCLAERCCRHKW